MLKLEANCNMCKTPIKSGEECYCEGCYSILTLHIEVLENEIEQLKERDIRPVKEEE